MGRLNADGNECFDCFGLGCANVCLPIKPKSETVSMVYGDIDNLEED